MSILITYFKQWHVLMLAWLIQQLAAILFILTTYVFTEAVAGSGTAFLVVPIISFFIFGIIFVVRGCTSKESSHRWLNLIVGLSGIMPIMFPILKIIGIEELPSIALCFLGVIGMGCVSLNLIGYFFMIPQPINAIIFIFYAIKMKKRITSNIKNE